MTVQNPPDASVSNSVCPHCNHSVDPSAKFCLACGKPIGNQVTTPQLTSPNPPPAPVQSYYPPSSRLTAPLVSPFDAAVNSLRNASRGIRIVGGLLFFLFFSPFVSCTNVGLFQSSRSEYTAAELVTGTIGSTIENRNQRQNDGGAFLLLSLIMQPIAGIALFVIGEKWAKRLDVQGSTLLEAGMAQLWLGMTLAVLCLFFSAHQCVRGTCSVQILVYAKSSTISAFSQWLFLSRW